MYVDTAKIKRPGKTYTRHLLRRSYREGGKVKHETIACLSKCTDDEIAALKLALKHKKNLASLASIADLKITLGKRIGAVWLVKEIAKRLGISEALGYDNAGRLALLQLIARLVDQGSRLSAVRFAERHAVCEILGIEKLDEDDLYDNLQWLADQQETIEQKLFNLRYHDVTPTLFLYDVTSSYLEGKCNEFADWGYSRDGKRGKMQIVVGLLAGPDGLPVAARVFKGNTVDTKTVSEQVRILAANFGVKEVTLVGDRGMLKGPQIIELPDEFRYVTAITKPQIRGMISANLIQYELFDENVCEVQIEGVRYILRKNPVRAAEIANTRREKFVALEAFVEKTNIYLVNHPRAKEAAALRNVTAKIRRFKAQNWLSAKAEDRKLTIAEDDDALEEAALLDGCYVIKSDVPSDMADCQILHDRYCDLEMVERSFRTMKTAHLELRPVFVRKEKSTRGHVFTVMLALLVQRELEKLWVDLDITVEEGIDELAAISTQEVKFGAAIIQNIPTPNPLGSRLLRSAKVLLPPMLPTQKTSVHTKKKLTPRNIS